MHSKKSLHRVWISWWLPKQKSMLLFRRALCHGGLCNSLSIGQKLDSLCPKWYTLTWGKFFQIFWRYRIHYSFKINSRKKGNACCSVFIDHQPSLKIDYLKTLVMLSTSTVTIMKTLFGDFNATETEELLKSFLNLYKFNILCRIQHVTNFKQQDASIFYGQTETGARNKLLQLELDS